MKIKCAACGNVSEFLEKIGFRDTCSSCDAWLHTCGNCAFWVNGQCTEPPAEKVRDPEGMNFCDWYQPRAQGEGRGAQKEPGHGDAATRGKS